MNCPKTNRPELNVPELDGPLYHGSTVRVERVDVRFSAPGKDFGRGFYMTTVKDQAAKFAALKARRSNLKTGYVSVFRYIHNPDIRIKKFGKADTEWLSFVVRNRGGSKQQTAQGETPFDILIGPVANDAVGLVVNQLLIGTYGSPDSPEALHTAIRLLRTTRLYDQVFFRTEEALSCLRFQGCCEIGID
jgi:hypothetical protein